ncbi:hypothetical protein HDA40_001816 [Hamadaea flava]|uniref:Carboxypeptidase regulatory-like domain-containing protein n=1 Tax=Hamadaea flava TaxID=1742688 RepID=A0ABV8LM79_9ACTN|nr:hypothetical protein [Hamadaea flava]MCP2323309.1 hypothetical protein [Hamadaea flava]
MKINRRRVIAMGGAVAAATALASPRPAAAAPAYDVTVSTVSGDRTRMSLHIMGADPVGAITARIHDTDGSVLATLTRFSMIAGTPTDSRWHGDEHVALPRLDRYDVSVEITAAAGGDPYTARFPKVFIYYANTFFDDLTVTPPIVDADHREVVIAGLLTWEDPATHVHTPLPGRVVAADVSFRSGTNLDVLRTTATTDALGRFEFREEFPTEARIGLNFYDELPYIFVSGSASVGSSIRQTRMSLAQVEPDVVFGDPVHLAGKLEMFVSGSWVGYSGQSILLRTPDDSSLSAVTDGDGSYQFVVAAGMWQYSAFFNAGQDRDFLVASAQASTTVDMWHRATFVNTRLWNISDGVFRMMGTVDYPDSLYPATTTLLIETMPFGGSTWKTYGTKVLGGPFSFEIDLTLPKQTYVRARVEQIKPFLAAVGPTFPTSSPLVRRPTVVTPPDPLPRR